VTVQFDDQNRLDIPVDATDLPAPDVARRWLDDEFTRLDCAPLRASGKTIAVIDDRTDGLLRVAVLVETQSSTNSKGWPTASRITMRSGTRASAGRAVCTCSRRPRWSSSDAKSRRDSSAALAESPRCWAPAVKACASDGMLIFYSP
jgi:hypothetical protein